MKEVTYEEWIKNPTDRLMWVWDSSESNKTQRKVIYFLDPNLSYPVIALTDDEKSVDVFRHCAEIEESKTRRMTNKELSRWLREKPTREYKYGSFISCSVYNTHTYAEDCGDKEVHNDIVIREDDGEWREPLVEIE